MTRPRALTGPRARVAADVPTLRGSRRLPLPLANFLLDRR
jgi:hypothetical protein